ncbi:MAG: hypothetical protein QG652_957, partial [Pseudomonadota bacterium]|nr:hypothetical protein [Pseudomonadota bacterium]
MRIETVSIKTVTILVFGMIGVVAIVLSLLAGSYFRQAAFDAQMDSLSRVMEVASQEMLKATRAHTFDLGAKLGQSDDIIQAVRNISGAGGRDRLEHLLDDPFINGFVGFSAINLEKLRIYNVDFQLLAESREGMQGLPATMPEYLRKMVEHRRGAERLKAVDVLWLSPAGPLNSTLVPIGGLHLRGYLEVVINPIFNLPDTGKITRTSVRVFLMSGTEININPPENIEGHLPVEYIMPASDGQPAFRIVGYENVDKLNAAMQRTQSVTTGGFLLLALSTLLFALWLFSRFLFAPLGRMVADMKQVADGKLDLAVNRKGLQEFSVLADAFAIMANQIKKRTGDLEHLLNLDESAILCFGNDNEAVYFNKGASTLFGYAQAEMSDLDAGDLFSPESVQRMREGVHSRDADQGPLHVRVNCLRKDGSAFERTAVVNPLAVMDGQGYAVVLAPVANPAAPAVEQSDQRINAIEESLNSLLEIAKNNPGLVKGLASLEQMQAAAPENEKNRLREQAVSVMCAALACWQHDLGKSKLDLAEASRIWPVYIDKSTPTTRTLDKYLHLDTCPDNPRRQ